METVVRFVRQKTSNGDLLEKTFREAQSVDSNCVWMSEEECLSFEARDKKSVFIFDKFEGQAFTHLVETGNRIYGASVILHCMKENEKLPKLDHPVHNLSMMGFIICCTNVPRDIRDRAQQLIQWMCGEISKEFHDKVTHLVAGEIGSKKYVVAATLRKPIMLPEWVNRVWEDSQTMFVEADNETYKSEYRCKVFQGCVITVSGLESDERVEVREIIEQEGGRYTGEMKLNECTHLIVNEPKGQKYEFAKKWKLPIVKPIWLFDSVDKGYCLDISSNYKVTSQSQEQKTTSTPTSAGPSSRQSYAPNISCVSVDHVNETAMDQTRMDQTRQQNDITLNQSVQQAPDTTDLDELDLKEIRNEMFLDGCKIFLSGFTGPRLEKLRRLINKGGGTRYSQINETISHVIIGNRVEEHVRLLQEGKFRISVVSSAWIVACAKSGTQAPEDLYTCLELPDVEPMTPVSKPRKSSVAAASVAGPARQAQVDPDKTIGQDDMQELLSQYLPQNGDMTDESAMMRAVEAAEHVAPENDEDMTQDPTQETQEGGIFAGKKLVFVGLISEEEQQLTAQITEADGIVVGAKSRTVPDFAVVPFNGCPVPMTVTEIVTNAYIQKCLEHGELLPIDENPMFTPITFRAESDPLEGCVLSVSGYTGVERDVLMHIAEQMGAKCQEYFVKKARKNLLVSTHLVVNSPSGSKFEAAKKWGLPAVDRGWLYECARSGNRVPEEPYLIDRPQDETNNETTMKEEPALQTPASSKTRQATTPAPQTPKSPAPQTPATSTAKEPKVHIPMENGDGVSSLSPKENHVPDRKEVNKLPNQRVKELITQTKQESPRQKKDSTGVDSPSQFLKPGVVYHANFDLTDCMSALETPEAVRKKRERKNSLPLAELLVKNLDVALKKSSVRQKEPGTPAPARRETINQSIFKEGPTGPLKGVVVAVSKKLSGQQSDINNIVAELGADYRWTYDQSCTHFVFQGRRNDTSKEFRTAREHGKIIVSPHWITMCKEQNAHVDEKLFPHDFNPNLSLSVTSTTKTETPKRLSTRRSARSRVKVEEAASPVLRAPKRTRSKATEEIDLTVDDGPAKKSPKKSPGNKKSPKVSDKEEDESFSAHDKTCSDDEMAAACQDVEQEHVRRKSVVPPATQPANTLAREAFVDDITSLMAATKTYSKGKRKSSRRTDSLSGEVAEEADAKQISLSRSSNKSEENESTPKGSNSRRATRNSLRTRAGKKSDAMTEPSQMVEVTWDDPQTRQQQEKLAAELAKNSESLSPRPVNIVTDEDPDEEDTTDEEIVFAHPPQKVQEKPKPREEERIQTPEPPSLAFPTAVVPSPEKTNMMEDEAPAEVDMDETVDEEKPPPVFLLSGMTAQERTDYGALVEELGGRVSDASHYDSNCTHLVVGFPTRNEKYLACVAAGKWVLHKSYFEACRQQNRFVEEDEHEWGSEATQAILQGQSSTIVKLARAAHRWRRQVIEGNGAFSNWTCVLHCDNKKEDGLMRLLIAGGATVRSTRPPFTNLEEVNFAFMDLGKVKQKVDVNEFLKAGVHCVKPEYMSSYLMEDPIPEPRKFCIPEVTGASR